jgi:hypothetical protein
MAPNPPMSGSGIVVFDSKSLSSFINNDDEQMEMSNHTEPEKVAAQLAPASLSSVNGEGIHKNTGISRHTPTEVKSADLDPGLVGIGIGGLGGASSAPHGRAFEGGIRGAAQGLGSVAGLGLGATGGAYLAGQFPNMSPTMVAALISSGAIGGGLGSRER